MSRVARGWILPFAAADAPERTAKTHPDSFSRTAERAFDAMRRPYYARYNRGTV